MAWRDPLRVDADGFSVVFAEPDNMFWLIDAGVRRALSEESTRTLEYFFGSQSQAAAHRLLAMADAAGLSERVRSTVCRDATQLTEALPAADMLVTESTPIGTPEIARAARLTVLQKFGAVLDDLAVEEAQARGVAVRTMARKTTMSCAEHVFALLLALARQMVGAHTSVVAPTDPSTRPATSSGQTRTSFNWAGIEEVKLLHGRTLGLLGFGEIAREVAARAFAFGMDVIYHKRRPVDPRRLPEPLRAAEPVDFATLFERADVVSVHLPSTSETERIVDAEALGRMRPSALFVNMSRGALVDEEALERALRTGALAGAGLDVYREEPVPLDSGLLTVDRVVWSPHVAAGSGWFVLDEVEWMVDAVARAERGDPAAPVAAGGRGADHDGL